MSLKTDIAEPHSRGGNNWRRIKTRPAIDKRKLNRKKVHIKAGEGNSSRRYWKISHQIFWITHKKTTQKGICVFRNDILTPPLPKSSERQISYKGISSS